MVSRYVPFVIFIYIDTGMIGQYEANK